MKRNSMLSRAFFRRPAVRALVPDYKLVLSVLVVGCESHAGVYIPAGLGEDTGLDPAPLRTALADLERHGHIVLDEQTGEVFIQSFYRDNAFKSPARVGQWQDDFKIIESTKLSEAVLKAIELSPECGLASIVKPIDPPVPETKTTPKDTKKEEKQEDSCLGVGVGVGIEVVEAEKPAAATEDQRQGQNLGSADKPTCASGADGNQGGNVCWPQCLLDSAKKYKNGDAQRDEDNMNIILAAIAEVGTDAVRQACGDARLPDAAVKAMKASGLLSRINAKKADENYIKLLEKQDRQAAEKRAQEEAEKCADGWNKAEQWLGTLKNSPLAKAMTEAAR